MRQPDFVIGDHSNPYLRRWWIIPRNRWCNVYLHQILRSDDDRALHDHPWWNVSILLRGAYREVIPHPVYPRTTTHKRRSAGSIVLRRATALHRLEVARGPVWSLFITGPRVREWGFACPQGWVRWDVFTSPKDSGQIGRGCD